MSEEYVIKDFWEMKSKINDPKLLKEYAREFYTNDFISNITKWKSNLSETNHLMKIELSKYYNFVEEYWEDMSYDYLCKNINDKIENWIETHGDIQPNDMYMINEELVNEYYQIQIDNMQNKKISINNILKSFKKIIAF